MGAAKETAGKKAFKMPHTLVIIFIIILAAVLFTWIVPSGSYVRMEDPTTGRDLIDPNSFHYVENTPVNPLRIMNYVIDGFLDAADLIFMLLFAGGAFHLITDSGALQASIAKVARKFSNRFYIFIPMLTLIFTLIATNQGVNLFIPFVPITVMLSFALGLDSLVGVSIILLGGAVGFSTGTLQTSTTLLAQEIAGLVPFSGIWYRAICLVVFYVITNIFLIRYAMRIKKNPQLSPMYDLDQESEMKASTTDLASFGELNARRVAILAALVITLAIIVYGGLTLDWDMAEFAAMFIWLAIGGSAGGQEPLRHCQGNCGRQQNHAGRLYDRRLCPLHCPDPYRRRRDGHHRPCTGGRPGSGAHRTPGPGHVPDLHGVQRVHGLRFRTGRGDDASAPARGRSGGHDPANGHSGL